MSSEVENVDVFVNCPFDDAYRPLFRASIFAIIACGFRARCALEISDAATTRLSKIYKIISESAYGVHDLSRTELDEESKLPRFNMPLELGIFLGCKQFGSKRHQKKVALVVDREKYRYQKFVSDLSGVDVMAHGDVDENMLIIIRDWLRSTPGRNPELGGDKLKQIYSEFDSSLPAIAAELDLDVADLTFADYQAIVVDWLRDAEG